MKMKKKFYQLTAAATALICAAGGPLGAGSVTIAYAAQTEAAQTDGKESAAAGTDTAARDTAKSDGQEQAWKKNTGAGEAIAQENIIKILSVEDLEALAQQCALDQWSIDKYVVLEADLDLTDSDFAGIPTFGGTFDGNGHTISGFSLKKSGDVNGFFRYVQEGATVKNLTVSGEVAPDGHRDVTGGLAGNNRGMLTNCSFSGTVKGKNRTGGIVGLNEGQGQIYNCSFEGDVTGEHYAGGIVGENLGSVVRCKNSGTVNITEVKVSTEVEEFGLEALGRLNAADNIPASTDIGGIAGASGGILQSCENTGDVGYPHVGYNVGGIVGRQSGYLDGCTNGGTINGRKDVGGIVGQFEPHVTLQYEPGMLDDLYTELEVLQGLIDTTIQDAKGVSTTVTDSIQGLSDSTKNVKSATQELTDGITGWADENIEAVNDFSARLSWALDQIVPAADDLGDSMDAMGDASELLADALKDGRLMVETGTDMVGGISGVLDGIDQAISAAQEAADKINEALKKLGEAIGDDEETQAAVRELGTAFQTLGGSLKDVGDQILDVIADNDSIDDGQKARLESMAKALQTLGGALDYLGGILTGITVENGELTGGDGLTEAVDAVAKAAGQLQIEGGTAADSVASKETGADAGISDAYAQVQRETSALGELLDEASALFEKWTALTESLEPEGETDAKEEAENVRQELLTKLEHIREKAQEISGALDRLEERTENEDSGLTEKTGNARRQLEQIRQTAEELAGQLDSAGPEKESAKTDGNEAAEEEPEESAGEMQDENAEETPDKSAEEKNGESTENALETSTEEAGNGGEGAFGTGEDETEGTISGNAYYTRESVTETGGSTENDGNAETGENTENAGSTTGVSGALDGLKTSWAEASQLLDRAFGSLGDSVELIGGSLDSLTEAGEYGAKAMGTLSKASSKMKDSFRSLSSAAQVIRDTLSGLAEQPAIQFVPLDSRISTQKDALDGAMDDMIAQVDNLNSAMSVSSDVMLADMEAINDQLGVIIGVLKQESEEEAEGVEDRIVDVSDEESEKAQEDGYVTGSVNKGTINGDVNVAGIVGAMAIEYDFDLEDDLTQNGQRSFDFSWLTSAVLSSCTNIGTVEAKKNCAGGIVGRMDMGKVSGCESYGPVTSSGGSYVGGIAGASYAVIRDSWAKCELSGADYVGGIAGLGTTIENCHTLVEITESAAFTGAIAGNVEEDAKLLGNTYVHGKLAAVDGISYAKKAEPVSYDQLLSGSETPEKFKEFELTFTADGEVVEVVPFQYGKGITSLPEIPAKEGCSAKWPDLDYSCLTFSQTVEAEYTAYESTLSAGGEIPVLLVDGSFSSEAVIEDETQELTFADEKGREHTGTCVTVRVQDPVLEEITYTVHYKLPDAAKRYRLWVRTADGWEKRDYETDGDYLLLKNSGEEVTFLLEEYSIAWLVASIALAAAALIIIVILVNVRSKKKRSGKKNKKPNKKQEKQ